MRPLTKIIELWNRGKASASSVVSGDRRPTAVGGDAEGVQRHGPDVLFVGLVGGEGGASVFMLEMACGMARRGISVKIVVPSNEGTRDYQERCRQRGIPVELTEWLNFSNMPPRLLRVRRYLYAIRLVQKFRAPVVHYHLGAVSALPHYLLRAMAAMRRPPIFVTAHNNCDDPRPDEPWASYWAAVAPRRIRKIICISKRGVERQLGYGIAPEQTEYIPNGIDITVFENGDPARARQSLGAPADARLIVSSSRMEPGKRPIEALEAFSLVASEFPDTHLVFVGRGSLMEEVAATAKRMNLSEKVHLVGYQTNIADWLAASTVWFLPTETEGFSLAVLEAMAAGCSIVTTNSPGNDELVLNDRNALVTEVGDVTAMAAALRLVLSDDDLRGRLRAGARRTAEQFSFERVLEAHLACYSQGHETSRKIPIE